MSEEFVKTMNELMGKYIGIRKDALKLTTGIYMIGEDILTCNYTMLLYRMTDFGYTWNKILPKLESEDREKAQSALHEFFEEMVMTLRARCRCK
ncbi:MAG: hypothetical protein MRT15_04155 [archaeon YNP-LCB-003-016]|jgi:hypothetical protein|uniref:hypothetical protein n=1 Tax=Candidatus Culexarchaeum yellowstonense TaxID=2928963 RepID=UPI0026EC317B|nr:hypothetical protein [Candidatus Culexarchaeum yellowstonense]MCR6691561.1 hypothetical protein [Candidatus Culexarchaeum yellowstonense]